MELNEKILYLRKNFKKNKNLFELILEKYENINYYIRVDYNPSLKGYYLYTCDLDYLDKKTTKYINRQFIKASAVSYVLDVCDNFNLEPYEFIEYDTDIVTFIVNDKTYKFNRYIPSNLYELSVLALFMGMYIPNRLHTIYEELVSVINGTSFRYEYNKEFKFDLFKDDLDKIYTSDVMLSGDEIYETGKVRFLEEFEGKYLGLIEGKDNYAFIIQIEYNKEKNTTRILNTCECVGFCKHSYAMINAIRDKKFNNFYKVRIIRKNEDAFERLMSVANSLLCIGAFGEKIQVLDDTFSFVDIPILNEDGDVSFEIIEDNDGELQEYVDKVVRGEIDEHD